MKKLIYLVVSVVTILTACGSKKTESVAEPSTAFIRPAVQKASAGNIDRLYVYSPQLGDTVTVDVWTPEGYNDADTTRYPVIYMHDGQNLYDASATWNKQSWEMDSVVSALVAQGVIEAPVIVGVHSVDSTRIGDLMPQKTCDYNPALAEVLDAYFPGMEMRGDAYASFIATTLKELVDSAYAVRTDMESTSVMGSSMGGLMSIYTMSEYPATFGGAGCLSTHWVGTLDGNPAFPEAMTAYLTDRLPRDGRHKLYLDHGTESIDSLYGPWNDRVIELANSIGYKTPGTLETFTDEGASHEERYWAARVHRPLQFLLKK